MKAAIIEELASTWSVMAEMEDVSNPARRSTLRECADALRMLLSIPHDREREMEELLRSACAIADRHGAETAWGRFGDSIRKIGLNGVTARTYRDLEATHRVQQPDSERDAALKVARDWIVKNRPAITLSRQSTVDEYMALLATIDAAMAAQQGEKGGA